jgi:8-oxo-dGTP pyrophosphatase MutT (NUDIX family)
MESDPRSRATMPGHLTGSAIVLSNDRKSLLLIHHRKLNRWLQPGGHLEPNETPLQAAHREVAEEAGLDGLELLPAITADPAIPLDIDIHLIPANSKKSEPAHLHHDFRYVMVVPDNQPGMLKPLATEVIDAKWCPLKGSGSKEIPGSVMRAVKWLEMG